MKLSALVAFIMASLLLSAAPSDALRGTRKQCNRMCAPKIEQDCREFRRSGKRACKRSILRICRNVSMDACLLSSTPTTTTTTTSVLPPTTQLLPTTTTTFVVPTTTQRNPTTTQTTTKPLTTTSTTAPFHYGGDWTFFGELVAETVDCVANDPYFDRDVVVSHSPGAADIAAGIEFLPALYGTADKNGFEVGTQIDLNECTQTVYFTAERTPRADRMNAELIIDTICPEEACTAWYFGDLEQ